MKFEIKRVKNGFRLIAKDYIENEDEEIVYQETESDEHAELKNFANFLYLIDREYGPTTSKYSEHRIRIILAPGQDWDGVPNKENCEENLKYFLEDEKDNLDKIAVADAYRAGWTAAKHDY